MNNNFAAFVIGRRSIAAAVLHNLTLNFWEVRSFHANDEQASSAITSFIARIVERCGIESAGLERLPIALSTRTAALTRFSQTLLHEKGIPVSTASEENLFAAYGDPPIKSRSLLRNAAL